ncbi:MAG: PASTA domain-containing protein, partial [Acidimicrobiales bacterium]
PTASTKHPSGTITVDVSIGNKLVTVPDLTGLAVDRATAELQSAGLVPGKPALAFSDTVPAGVVSDWSPKTQAEEKSTVALTESRGAEFVIMPDVTNQPIAQAQQALVAKGFDPSQLTTSQDFSDTVPKGSVISTNPPAGGRADRGATVGFVVSQGPQLFKVPNVEGMSAGNAQAVLQQAGFPSSVSAPLGGSTVILQQPSAGSMVKKGTKVNLIAA